MRHIILFAALMIVVLIKSARVIPQNYRGLVCRLGRLDKRIREPGLNFLIPFLETLELISVRQEIMSIPSQEIITHDNKTAKVEADIHFQIKDPLKTKNVSDIYEALRQTSQNRIRTLLGKVNSEEISGHQESLGDQVRGIIDKDVREWGLEVSKAELKCTGLQ